ncbi:TPA: ESPR-type extended signal peptide-containing protein [Haemophilus influenzae]
MNKIFNVIWNVMTQTWVVVSELTRTHTKCASATVAVAVLATLFSATVQASAANDDENLEPVERSPLVLLFTSDKEGTGERNLIGEEKIKMTINYLKGTEGDLIFKVGDNLKIEQHTNNRSFTYSLKKDLTGLTSVETKKLSIGENGNKVNITSDIKGLNLAKAVAGANNDTTLHLNGIASTLQDTLAGTQTTKVEKEANTITDEEKHRAASVQDVFNAGWNIKGVKTGITISDNVDFVRTYDTVEFLSADTETTTVTVDSKENGKRTEVKIGAKTSVIKDHNGKLFTGKDLKDANNGATVSEDDSKDTGVGLVTAKAVIDAVNKSGWRIKTTGANGQVGKFETVTSGTNVTFADGNGTTAVVTGDATNGITVKYDAKVGDGLKIGDDQKITADTVTLTVNSTDGDAPAAAGQGADTNNRGKVVVTGVADLTKATDADKKKVATVVDVAKAINDAATFVKVQSSDEDIENDAAGKDDTKDQSLKAGDTLTLKAGKNLKAKLDGKSVTFALAKDITTENATFSNKLSIGGAATTAPKVDITSTDDGLNFAQNGKAGKDAYVHLTGIATTLNEPASAGAKSTHVDLSLDDAKKSNAASIEDVLRAGWNIQGNDNNVDYVATYDTVNFKDDGKTTTVTVTQKANGKGADVAIGAKTSVIKEKDGKLFTGKDNKETNNVVSTTATDNADEGNGLVTAKAVIDAVNSSGWRVKTTGTPTAGKDGFETVTSGTNVTFANSDSTTASVTKDANGITVKYEAKVGDGLKVDATKGIVADTTALTVADGKVTTPTAETDKKKLVNAEGLADALNKLSWKAVAGKDDGGEVEPNANNKAQEVKAGETVTFKAGKNLKVKQDGANFTYSLKDTLSDLTSITLGKTGAGANGATTQITNEGLTITPANGATTQITNEGLTITPANGAGAGTNTANTISVTKDGIKAGNKEITNVASALTTYGATPNGGVQTQPTAGSVDYAKKDLVDLTNAANAAAGGTTTNNELAKKAATVGDLAGLGWVLSADKTTKDGGGVEDNPFHAAVKNANEVEFKGKGAATVSAKSDGGKYVVTVDVKETYLGDGLEKENGKIKVKASKDANNLLTVTADGASVTKGEFNTVDTSVPADDATTETKNNRGKVTVKDADKADKSVATVKDVAEAINSAATFVKTANLDTALDEADAKDEGEDALKAGDTLTFNAGKNLKVKRDGKNITFDLAKNLEAKTATFSDKLSIGSGTNVVDITNENGGLKLSKGTADIQLRGIGSTLTDTITGTTTKAENGVDVKNHNLAASVKDVLSAGWNIKGVTTGSATGKSENVDFVRTYDTVEFLSASADTTCR